MNNGQTPGGNTTTAGAVEMARRIAWEQWPSSHDFSERDAAEAAALAAIIETQERCARVADWWHMVPPDGGSPTDDERIVAENIAAAIRSGQQFRKDV